MFFPVLIIFGEPNENGSYGVNGLPAFLIFLFTSLYFLPQEGCFGQTLGKRLLGIMVIDENGKSISFAQAFLRFLAGVIDYSCLYIGVILAADHPKNKRLGDHIAKTLVVKK